MIRKRLWITWEDQRRNRELSKALGAKLFEFKDIDLIKNPFRKYLFGIVRTIKVILREKPGVVFGQNPSIVLSFFLICVKRFLGIKVVIDAHNAGIFPAEGKFVVLMTVSRFIQRNADLVIITNKGMKQHVESNGGKAFILQDKIPDIPLAGELRELKGKVNLLFICSYAADEPYQAVIEAAASLPEDIFIYITGNYKKADHLPVDLPANIRLTGFLPTEEFENFLHSVDATIDLTAREDCLVCGAYESVAVGKPMILSDTKALRDYFYVGAVYTLHTVAAIQQAVMELVARREELTTQAKRLKKERIVFWKRQRQLFEQYLAESNF